MLYNSSLKKRICTKTVRLDNIFSIGTGLMMRSHDAVMDKAWIFIIGKPRIISITTFFMRYPIDILFLDESRKIISLKTVMKTWSLYSPGCKASYVIELDAGYIRKNKLKIGHKLTF